MKAKVWIARDKEGDLYLYESKPLKRKTTFADYFFIRIDSNSHPEITWENSPQQIEI